MEVGHTKFKPDKLFASIAKTFYDRDAFCIEMLQAICELYSVTHTFSSGDIFQWRSCLEDKYSAVPGITLLRDFIVTKHPFNIGINATWTIYISDLDESRC